MSDGIITLREYIFPPPSILSKRNGFGGGAVGEHGGNARRRELLALVTREPGDEGREPLGEVRQSFLRLADLFP